MFSEYVPPRAKVLESVQIGDYTVSRVFFKRDYQEGYTRTLIHERPLSWVFFQENLEEDFDEVIAIFRGDEKGFHAAVQFATVGSTGIGASLIQKNK